MPPHLLKRGKTLRPVTAISITLSAIVLVIVSAVLTKPASSGTFPGTNGKIAFVAHRDGNNEIYLESVISTGSYRITERDADDQTPVWSMSGDLIAYTSNASGQFEVYITEFVGTEGKVHHRSPTGQVGRPVPWQD